MPPGDVFSGDFFVFIEYRIPYITPSMESRSEACYWGCIPIYYLHKGLNVKGPYGSIFPVFILNISLPLRFTEYFRTEFVWLYPAASDSLCMQLLVLGKRRRSLYAYEYLVLRMNRYVLKPSKERNRRVSIAEMDMQSLMNVSAWVLGNLV